VLRPRPAVRIDRHLGLRVKRKACHKDLAPQRLTHPNPPLVATQHPPHMPPITSQTTRSKSRHVSTDGTAAPPFPPESSATGTVAKPVAHVQKRAQSQLENPLKNSATTVVAKPAARAKKKAHMRERNQFYQSLGEHQYCYEARRLT
jgi:hypothetical protein